MATDSTRKLIFVNGPPRAGKDTVADYIAEAWSAVKYKQTSPMDRAVKAYFNMTDEEFAYYRETVKDEPQEIFRGHTMRTVLIDFSEKFIKPLFGKDMFGWLGSKRFFPDHRLVVCSDSGFFDEAKPYVDMLGAENILLIRIHRPGHTFTDSRSYIDLSPLGVTTLDVVNGFDIPYLNSKIDGIVDAWLSTTHQSQGGSYEANNKSLSV